MSTARHITFCIKTFYFQCSSNVTLQKDYGAKCYVIEGQTFANEYNARRASDIYNLISHILMLTKIKLDECNSVLEST